MMIGVPVNPIRAALGRAFIRLACSTVAWERWASSTITRIEPDSFSVSNVSPGARPSPPPPAVSRYFWIIAITTAEPGRLSSSRTSAPLRATRTVSPASSAVLRSCLSRSVRSVTSTILNRRRSGWLRMARIRNTMVRLLPDPWVCQMIPPRRSTWPSAGRVSPSISRRSALCTPRYCW